jgi:hypothetical protein
MVFADRDSLPMSEWPADKLKRIGAAEEVQIVTIRPDGTLRKPVTMWAVRHGDDLYIRSVRGRSGHWFRGAQERHEGRLRAGGLQQDVTFVDGHGDLDKEIDAPYQAKYRRYAGPILDSVLTAEARSATLRLVPRSTR